jgi:hypothetical protein
VILNGKIFTIGGHRGNLTNESGEKTVEVYDPAGNSWTSAADMLIILKMMTACVWNGKIYVFGGAEGYCTPSLPYVHMYYPESDSWTELTEMPRGLSWQSSTVANDKIFICGGWTGGCTASGKTTSSIFEFNPDNIVSSKPEEHIRKEISIYPNPVSGFLNMHSGTVGIYRVDIYSYNGQIVQSYDMNQTISQLDLSSFQPGVYFISIRSKDFVETRKIIKLQ